MDLDLATLRQIGAIVAAILNLAIAGVVLSRGPRRRPHWVFGALCLAFAAWNLGFYLQGEAAGHTVRFFRSLGLIGVILVPALSYHFVIEFLQRRERRHRQGLLIVYGTAAGFLVSVLIDHRVAESTVWRLLLGGYLFPSVFYAISLVFEARDEARSALERRSLSTLLWASLIAAGAGLIDVLPTLARLVIPVDVELGVGNIANVFYALLVAWAIERHRLLDVRRAAREVFTKVFQAALFFFISVAFYGLLPGARQAPFVVFAAISIVLAVGFEPLKDLATGLTEQLLSPGGWEEALSRYGRAIARATTIDELAYVLRRFASELLRPWRLRILLYQREAGALVPLGEVGSTEAIPAPPATFHGTFVDPEPVEREEILELLAERPRDDTLREVRRIMEVARSSVLVPLRSKGSFHGFLGLGRQAGDSPGSPPPSNVLSAIATQVALAIDNIRLYDEIRSADRLKNMGEMAAGVAHEIKNPLGAIKAAADVLSTSPPRSDDGSSPELVEIIQEESNRLQKLIEHFLAFARPPHPDLVPEDLNRVIERSIRSIRQGTPPRIAIRFRPARELPEVLLDAEQLRQVLYNLVRNAAEAIDGDGEVVCRTRPGPSGGADLVIADDGPGIPAEVRRDIFTPFRSTKHRGTGLGLAIVQRIVLAHGGAVYLIPDAEAGATFLIRFPPAEEEAGEEEPVPPPPEEGARVGGGEPLEPVTG